MAVDSLIDRRPKVIVITGPTASGKSRVAVELALRLGAEIVNADSMQVYRGMDVGTAKPGLRERESVRHHMLDVVDPDEEFNAAKYRAMALRVVNEIVLRGKACLVVGGTGLYIKALTRGLLPCPDVDPVLREWLKNRLKLHGLSTLYEELRHLDPDSAAKIHPNDPVRTLRALEIILLSRQKLSELVKAHGFQERTVEALIFCLQVPREILYDRINQRAFHMVHTGLIEETQDLLNKGYSPELKPMRAIGYRHAVEYLSKDIPMEEMVGTLQRDTRRYAKRQLTWFRRIAEAVWVKPQKVHFMYQRIQAFLGETA